MITARPTATVTIEAIGDRNDLPCDHAIKVTIKLSSFEPRFADKGTVLSVVSDLLRDFVPATGGSDLWRFDDVTVTHKGGKVGASRNEVVGIEGSVVWPGRPGDDHITRLRAELVAQGYLVALREKRRCAEPACSIDTLVPWNQPLVVPVTWYSSLICGRHDYRACAKCKSVYVLTSTNAAGQNPSVHCEVCGLIMIEWGSSKIWSAILVTRAALVS